MTKQNVVLGAIAMALLWSALGLAFLFRYDHVGNSNRLVRTNRLTGATEQLTDSGWRDKGGSHLPSLSGPAPASTPEPKATADECKQYAEGNSFIQITADVRDCPPFASVLPAPTARQCARWNMGGPMGEYERTLLIGEADMSQCPQSSAPTPAARGELHSVTVPADPVPMATAAQCKEFSANPSSYLGRNVDLSPCPRHLPIATLQDCKDAEYNPDAMHEVKDMSHCPKTIWTNR